MARNENGNGRNAELLKYVTLLTIFLGTLAAVIGMSADDWSAIFKSEWMPVEFVAILVVLGVAYNIELYQLRRDNRDRLNMEWSRLLQIEQNFGDVAGVNAAASYRMFREFRPLPSVWRFELDPADIGLKEQWEQTGSGKIQTVWEPIQTDRPWESQTLEGMHPALKQRLKNYDGVGWYGVSFSVDPKWKGSEISLSFGAVDESAWIWVNGKKAGERLYRNSDDWKNPFTIRIDSCIDWRKPRQTVVVRVHDSGGQGGIWKPVVLVRK